MVPIALAGLEYVVWFPLALAGLGYVVWFPLALAADLGLWQVGVPWTLR